MVLKSIVAVFAILTLSQTVSASDELYRCSDGTFTNRVERQCQPYDSTAVVQVQTGHSDESKTTMKKDEPTQPFAEVKVYQRPTMSETEPRR
jgi:hypothetical protein